jgi:dynein light intermediate chain
MYVKVFDFQIINRILFCLQISCVSRHPATKTDVYHLEKNLDHRLKLSKALEVGLCSHRRTIYNECFDELVRQITIECSERGILLSRIRHTYRQMMNEYSNNYISSNAYAMRTLLLNEQIKVKLNNQIDHLQYDIEQLKRQLINAEDHFENVLKLYSNLKSSIEYRYQSINTIVPLELQQLRTTNKLLKQELENVLLKKLNFYVPERINQKNNEVIK